MRRKKLFDRPFTDFYLDNAGFVEDACSDDISPMNTFHNLVMFYAAGVSDNIEQSQQIHDEIAAALHLPLYANFRLLIDTGMYVVKKTWKWKHETCDAIGRIFDVWWCIICLNFDRSDPDVKTECEEIMHTVGTYFRPCREKRRNHE